MAFSAIGICENAENPVSLVPDDGTSRSSDETDAGGCVDGAVTVEILRTKIDREGGRITAAIATLRTSDLEQSQYRLYLRCSWLPDAYYGVAVHRGRALRVHKTFDPWIVLLEGFGYLGPVTVYRESDPALAQLGILGRPAS